MAARKTPIIPESPFHLREPRAIVAQKVAERIEKGKQLLGVQVDSEQDYETCHDTYLKWTEFNTELLTRIFTSRKAATEYGWWGIAGGVMNPTLRDKAREGREALVEKIRRLESLHERLELIPEDASVASAAGIISASITEIGASPRVASKSL